MNDVINVLFADDNADFCEIIKDYFSAYRDIKIVSIARNGLQAYDMIIKNKPDIVVLDLIMPYIDGIGVLEKLKSDSSEKMPLIIILSAAGQENITQKAISLGAHYYFVKPFNLDLLAERIRLLGTALRSDSYYSNNKVTSTNKGNGIDIKKDSLFHCNTYEGYVTRLIRELGIPAHIKGYQFLRDAIMMAHNEMDMINSITKLIYPDIAKRYNTTTSIVESAIRHAIEVAWRNGDHNSFKRIFGYDVAAKVRRPSNSEFIATIVDTLRMEMD